MIQSFGGSDRTRVSGLPALPPLPKPHALTDPTFADSHPLSGRTLGGKAAASGEDATKEAFQDFVGQTLFGQMLSSMRSTIGKPAYFHGGRGEEVFQQQLDEVLVEKISDASASTVADPMYELFRLQRSQ